MVGSASKDGDYLKKRDRRNGAPKDDEGKKENERREMNAVLQIGLHILWTVARSLGSTEHEMYKLQHFACYAAAKMVFAERWVEVM